MRNPPFVLAMSLVVFMFILAMCIALGKVEQTTSHGLDQLLGSFQTLAGGASGYFFGRHIAKGEKPPPPEGPNGSEG